MEVWVNMWRCNTACPSYHTGQSLWASSQSLASYLDWGDLHEEWSSQLLTWEVVVLVGHRFLRCNSGMLQGLSQSKGRAGQGRRICFAKQSKLKNDCCAINLPPNQNWIFGMKSLTWVNVCYVFRLCTIIFSIYRLSYLYLTFHGYDSMNIIVCLILFEYIDVHVCIPEDKSLFLNIWFLGLIMPPYI